MTRVVIFWLVAAVGSILFGFGSLWFGPVGTWLASILLAISLIGLVFSTSTAKK